VLFYHDLGPLRTAYRSAGVVAHLAAQMEFDVQHNHLANPGNYLRALDNVDVRDLISSSRLLGMAAPHLGHFHRYCLTRRWVLRQPGPPWRVIQMIIGVIFRNSESIKEAFLLRSFLEGVIG
jgi:hypothetical protein